MIEPGDVVLDGDAELVVTGIKSDIGELFAILEDGQEVSVHRFERAHDSLRYFEIAEAEEEGDEGVEAGADGGGGSEEPVDEFTRLTQLPGVGDAIAGDLFEQGYTVEDVATLDDDVLTQFPGIGDAKVAEIREAAQEMSDAS